MKISKELYDLIINSNDDIILLSTIVSGSSSDIESISSALSSEISSTNSDITSLSTAISSEISDRTSVDNSLSTAISSMDVSGVEGNLLMIGPGGNGIVDSGINAALIYAGL